MVLPEFVSFILPPFCRRLVASLLFIRHKISFQKDIEKLQMGFVTDGEDLPLESPEIG